MTNIEFFRAVANGETSDEIIAKAIELVDKDIADKQKAAEKRAEKRASDNENLMIARNILTDTAQSAISIMNAMVEQGAVRQDGKDFTVQYIARLMKTFVDAGEVVKTKVTAKGADGKYKQVTGYALVTDEEE